MVVLWWAFFRVFGGVGLGLLGYLLVFSYDMVFSFGFWMIYGLTKKAKVAPSIVAGFVYKISHSRLLR